MSTLAAGKIPYSTFELPAVLQLGNEEKDKSVWHVICISDLQSDFQDLAQVKTQLCLSPLFSKEHCGPAYCGSSRAMPKRNLAWGMYLLCLYSHGSSAEGNHYQAKFFV